MMQHETWIFWLLPGLGAFQTRIILPTCAVGTPSARLRGPGHRSGQGVLTDGAKQTPSYF